MSPIQSRRSASAFRGDSRRLFEEIGIASQCARCGRLASPEDRFCGDCGTPLTEACRQCGKRLPPDVAFCTACGTARSQRQPLLAPTPFAEDRRRVSVLFVDLVDFTPYVERADPEMVRELQTGFFAIARKVIGQYGGVVEKYIGDAVMALFGAPIATENDAVRCVRAGLDLQRSLARFTPAGSNEPRFRVGVATGEALVNVAAARDGGQAIVAGDVVNTASRLQSVAPPGGVLVCGTTCAATRGAIHYQERPPVLLRGRSTPTEVWLALAPQQAPGGERDLTTSVPLVNRKHELGLLINALHRALRERTPQMVTVLGHAGIGKSRLVHELYQHARYLLGDRVVWHTGQCPPFGENVTYAALADIVKAEAGVLDTDTADTAGERLTAALQRLVDPEEIPRLLDALSPLLGLSRAKLAPEEAESARRRFVAALASRHPTVLVFEDLHWADERMLRLVELLGASIRNVPLLLLCTARPELSSREPTWSTTIGGALAITLPPLRDAEIADMYAHLLGRSTFSTDALEPLVELAHGNPLYAHEYTKMLVERGVERLRLDTTVPMPDSVHAVIANRVDLLAAADRVVLQGAAVVGMQFWPATVAAAIGRPAEAVERSLRSLEQRDLVHEQPTSIMAGQQEYRFGHVLVRDVCYQRLPRTERIARHERTADWLDAIASERETDLAEVLAHHRYTAHEIARILGLDTARYAEPARDALHRAARRAYSLHALDVASGHVGRALALCGDSTSAVDRLQLELLATEISFYVDVDAFLHSGGTQQLTGLAEQFDAAGDRACAARAWTLLGQAAWLRADRQATLTHLDKALTIYDDLPDSEEKADAFAEVGRLRAINFEHDQAVAAADIAADIAERLRLDEVRANARITIALARYYQRGRDGLLALRELYEECRAKKLSALRRAALNLAFAVAEEGDWHSSQALEAEVAQLVVDGNNLYTAYSADAQAAYFDGDWAALLEAAAAMRSALSGESDLQVHGLQSWITLLRQASPADAEDPVADLLAAGERSGFHRLRWNALAHSALCRVIQGRLAECSDLLTELVAHWRRAPTISVGEWIPAAAHAAALAGRSTSAIVAAMLRDLSHYTRWTTAALLTVSGELEDDAEKAIRYHQNAIETYAGIPNATERGVALAVAVRTLSDPVRSGPDRADPAGRRLGQELREFAERNAAPGLLELARLS